MTPRLNTKLQWQLLLWKNWKQHKKNWLHFVWILVIPIVVHAYLFVELAKERPNQKPKAIYTPMNLKLDDYRNIGTEHPDTILYTPKNNFFDNVLKEAKRDIGISYKSTQNEQTLEDEVMKARDQYMAGVTFNPKVLYSRYLTQLDVKIRFPSELRRDRTMSWETGNLLPHDVAVIGPRNPNDNDGGIPVGYLSEGFLQLQNSIVMGFLKEASGYKDLPQIHVQRFPYQEYTEQPMCTSYTMTMMPSTVFLSFLYPVIYITYIVTEEKTKCLKEMVKTLGIESFIYFSSWFVTAFLLMEMVVIILTVLYKMEIESECFPNSGWITILFIFTTYAMALICFCIMTSTFFNSPLAAVYFVTAIYLFSNLLLRVVYDGLSIEEKLGYCMLTNSAMNIACLLMRRLECSGFGVKQSTIWVPSTLNDSLPLGVVMLLLILQSIGYFLIALYVDQVYPGEFGVGKSWYYPLTAQFWCNRREKLAYDEKLQNLKIPSARFFEPEEHTGKPILEAKNLTRMLGSWVIIKNVSFNLYANDINVLLGPAGSGKSVLLSLLTGARLPHRGTALIVGRDVRIVEQEACRLVGTCFGDSVLWENMTAEEHFKFYSKIKSKKGRASEDEVDKYVDLLRLGKKGEEPISKLKIGDRRKIMICNALFGNVKVLMCEDPTKGLDPDTRSEVWALLRTVKRGRTIIITTESLFEAEMLSDRIAILVDGELKCFGSKFFLKKLYGSGHRLICTKKENCDIHVVSDVLRPFIADARPIKNSETEIVYVLPDYALPLFPEIFRELESNLNDLKLETFTVETASMEEVYMSAGGDNHFEDLSVRTKPRSKNLGSAFEEPGGIQPALIVPFVRRKKGCGLLCSQWKAMFLKKFLISYNSKLIVFIQIFLPSIILLLRKFFFGGAYNPFFIPPMTFDLNQYQATETYVDVDLNVANHSFERELIDQLEYVISGKHHEIHIMEGDFSKSILELETTMQPEVDKTHIFALSVQKGNIVVWINNKALHSAPLGLNIVHNAMAKVLLGDTAKIIVTNHPFQITARMAQKRIDDHSNIIQNYLLSQVIVLSLYVLNPNNEHVSKIQQLQFTCGVKIWIYWISHLLWDLVSVTISSAFFAMTMAFTEGYAVETELESLFPVTIALGFCVLNLTYLLSFIFDRAQTAFGVLVFFYYVGKLLVQNMIITYGLEESYFFWFPFTAYAKACDSIQLVSIMNRDCQGQMEQLDEKGNCKLLQICCVPRGLLGWHDPGILVQLSWLLGEGIFFFIIVLIIDYQIVNRLYDKMYHKILKHFRSHDKSWERFKRVVRISTSRLSIPATRIRNILFAKVQRKRQQKEEQKQKRMRSIQRRQMHFETEDGESIEPEDETVLNEDDDVLHEQRYIKSMKTTDVAKRNLVVDRISKYHRRFPAVDNLSLQLKKRECFGLAGIDGCGKSTLLKILINETYPTSGNFYIRGRRIPFQPDSSKKEIGYCPEKDAFFKTLTGRQNLKVFLLCRGVEWRNLNQLANELACTFQMSKILDSKSKYYGRGSSRKLSLAIAIIGLPSILFFDEPTSNIDPISKRRIWDVINKLREMSKTVVISTKNIDECESLCTRMSIMVNGKMMCLGSKQHLREKYSQGCILTLKFLTELEQLESEEPQEHISDEHIAERRSSQLSDGSIAQLKDIEEFIQKKFPQSRLRQRLHGYRIYYIPNNDMKWSDMFATIEKYRKILRIQDYSISQKSLEEIYLDFSKYQKTRESMAKYNE